MRGARVTELMHGELEVEPGAIVAGQIGKGVSLEDTAMISEPESVAGARALHAVAAFLEVAFQKGCRGAGDGNASVPTILGVLQVKGMLFESDGAQGERSGLANAKPAPVDNL